MKVSFGQTATAEQETPTTEAAVALRDDRTVSTAVAADTDDMQGEFTASDLRLPRINLANKSGKLGDDFGPGAFVLNKEVRLSDGKTPLTVIALRIKKQFQENLKFDPDSDARPRTFDTIDEVRANGGTLGYKKDCGEFSDIAHIEFLVKAPEGAEEEVLVHFTDEIEGSLYCRAVYTAASTAYAGVAKPIITARLTHLKATGLPGGRWEMTSRLTQGKSNSWYSPVLKAAGLLTPEGVVQAKALVA